MTAANVVAFQPAGEMDIEQVHARAGSLDFLAELVDNVVTDGLVDADPDLPEQLRRAADELVELSCAPELDVLALNQALARSADLLQVAVLPICRSSTRRMLGAQLYDRISDAVFTLGELGAVAFERTSELRDAYVVGIAPMRRFTRLIASAYDWANWNVDAPVHLRPVLLHALRDAAADANDEVDISHDMAPTDAGPLANALDELHDAWLKRVPADVLAEYVAERDQHGGLGECFDLGVACSIARRLIPLGGVDRVPDSASVAEWLAAADA